MKARTRPRRSTTRSGMTTVSICGNDRTDMRDAFQAGLAELLGREVEISEPVLLASGASKEAWAGGAAVGGAGEPCRGEGRRGRMAEERGEVDEPHPAIELGLWWLRENRPPARPAVVNHGDYRIGNVVVGPDGLVGVLDWEFAHLDDPVRDLAFGMVRAWRFGVLEKRFGGISDGEPFVERYNELTGFAVRPEELDYWELAGNVAWAIGCLTQAQRHLSGLDRSIELATLGRLSAEVEYEICRLLERFGA